MAREGTRRGARGPDISLTVTPEIVRLNPGGRAELRLVIASTDPTASPTRYHLDVTGLQRLWYTLGKTDILLDPGARETVLLVLHPLSGKAAPGRYTVRVKATWPANPSIGASDVITLTVAPAVEPGAAAPGQPGFAAVPIAPPAQPATRRAAALPGQPLEQPGDAPPARPTAATPWTAAARPGQRRRLPLVAGFAILLLLLFGEGAVLAARLSAPQSASNHATAPVTTPTALLRPTPGVPRRTPYSIVAGAVARAPVIRRFAVVPGGPGRPDILVWHTENAAVVTIDGHTAPPRGTRAIHPSIYGSSYSLRARTRGHVVTMSVHAVAVNPIAVAASVPVALLNLTALRFPDRSIGAAAPVQTVRIVNLGPVPLAIARIAVEGNRADFTVRATCARRTLPVDVSCTIDVRFAPTRRGARHATLAIAANTAAGSQRIPLDGNGV